MDPFGQKLAQIRPFEFVIPQPVGTGSEYYGEKGMKRILMSMTALIAFAAGGNAQSLSGPSLQMLCEAEKQVVCTFFCPGEVNTVQVPIHGSYSGGSGRGECASECEGAWYTQAVQHGLAAWQRVRAIYGSNSKASPCCEAARPADCQTVGSCPVGAAACGQPETATTTRPRIVLSVGVNGSIQGCPIQEFLKSTCPLGFTTGKATAPCCCAKACACCETCKAKAASTVQARPFPVAPSVTWTQPAQPPTWTGPAPQTWALPVPPPPGSRVVVGLPTSGNAAKPAHLVTPDLEAHCQSIIHRDGLIILEGNVLLLCKKHAQPLRIEAQRVLVNMNDGSFTVEASTRPTPSMAPVGVLRMSNQPQPNGDVYYPAPPAPQRVIEFPAWQFPR